MALRILVQPDYPVDALEIDIADMAHVLSLAVHLKPWSVVQAMRAKRHMWQYDDADFENGCRWVMHGSTSEIYNDTDLLGFIVRCCVETLGITHEQELGINPHLRNVIAYDKACASEPFPLPEAAE